MKTDVRLIFRIFSIINISSFIINCYNNNNCVEGEKVIVGEVDGEPCAGGIGDGHIVHSVHIYSSNICKFYRLGSVRGKFNHRDKASMSAKEIPKGRFE